MSSKYLWTYKADSWAHCPLCAKSRLTYGELRDGVLLICCCICQRILGRDTETYKDKTNA